MAYNESPDTALGRGIRIIDYIASQGNTRFSDIKKLLGNPSPTLVSRLLATFQEMNVIRRREDGLYTLTSKVKAWSKNLNDLKDTAMPFMEEIHQTFKVSVVLFEKVNGEAVSIARLVDENSPGLMAPGSVRLLPSILGMGTVFFSSPEEFDNCQAWDELKNVKGKQEIDKIKQSFAIARKTGVWHDKGFSTPNFERIATPIILSEECIGVLGIGTTSGRCKDASFLEALKLDLINSCKQISEAMKGNSK